MKVRSIIIALAIVLTPFIIGMLLFLARGSGRIPVKAHLSTDTRRNNEGMAYKGIEVNWTFYSDWKYKPLFFHVDEYFVFVFHYTNSNAHDVVLMPSYTFVPPGNKRYSANEEISMYIEDGIERTLNVNDQTPITFKLSSNEVKDYIVTFEKSPKLKQFYVDVDIWKDVSLRIYYRKIDDGWEYYKSERVNKYIGRG